MIGPASIAQIRYLDRNHLGVIFDLIFLLLFGGVRKGDLGQFFFDGVAAKRQYPRARFSLRCILQIIEFLLLFFNLIVFDPEQILHGQSTSGRFWRGYISQRCQEVRQTVGQTWTRTLAEHLIETAVRVLQSMIPDLVDATETGIQRTRKWLTSSNQGPPPPSAVPIVFFSILLVFLDKCLHNLFHIADLDQDVFRFQVGVDNAAISVHVVQAK